MHASDSRQDGTGENEKCLYDFPPYFLPKFTIPIPPFLVTGTFPCMTQLLPLIQKRHFVLKNTLKRDVSSHRDYLFL